MADWSEFGDEKVSAHLGQKAIETLTVALPMRYDPKCSCPKPSFNNIMLTPTTGSLRAARASPACRAGTPKSASPTRKALARHAREKLGARGVEWEAEERLEPRSGASARRVGRRKTYEESQGQQRAGRDTE